jgi:hypothetical protein
MVAQMVVDAPMKLSGLQPIERSTLVSCRSASSANTMCPILAGNG